jgi:hypothetical protein
MNRRIKFLDLTIRFGWLNILLMLALIIWAWLIVDLVLHPFAPGSNAGWPIFRWLSGLTGTLTVFVALFIMRRVPGNIVGPLLLLYGVGAVIWSGRVVWGSLEMAKLASAVLNIYFFSIASPVLILLLFFFPTGRAYPAWAGKWMLPLAIGMSILGVLGVIATAPAAQSNMPNPLYLAPLAPFLPVFTFLEYVLCGSAALLSLIFRYSRAGTRERLQLKWLVWLFSFILSLTLITTIIPREEAVGRLGFQFTMLITVTFFIAWQAFPAVGIGVAMLRHNLWGIDVIIRRTLVYSALTATLALVYFGSVVLLQGLFEAVSGQRSAVAIVISTLVIAALFSPLRKRIQNDIDRRFFRKKYDAERIVATFGASLREEVDLEELSVRLLEVVEETLQPAFVGLWLAPFSKPSTPIDKGNVGDVPFD